MPDNEDDTTKRFTYADMQKALHTLSKENTALRVIDLVRADAIAAGDSAQEVIGRVKRAEDCLTKLREELVKRLPRDHESTEFTTGEK